MNEEKQILLISYLISSTALYALAFRLVKAKYFEPSLQNAVRFIEKYNEQYNAVPDVDQIKAESGLELKKYTLTKDQIEYTAIEIEQFCRDQALVHAVLDSASILNQSVVDVEKVRKLINDAADVTLHRELGVSVTDDPEGMIEQLKQNPKQSSGWASFDRVMEGGLQRQELLLWSAPPKGGKSITMQNLCLNFALQGKKVLYISLELSKRTIWKRIAQMITSIPSKEIVNRSSEVIEKIVKARTSMAPFIIEQMPAGTRPVEIRSYLKEFELEYGWIPDLFALDYLELCYPNERSVSLSDVWMKDKLVSEQIRQIIVDFDMYGTSASQLGRIAIGESTFNSGMIAGGISKVNTTDDLIGILQTDVMKAQGVISFQFLANRNVAVDTPQIDLAWDRNSLRISDLSHQPIKNDGQGWKSGKEVKQDKKNRGDDLIGIMPD